MSNQLLIYVLEQIAERYEREHAASFSREQGLRAMPSPTDSEAAVSHGYELGSVAAFTAAYANFERQIRDLIQALSEETRRG